MISIFTNVISSIYSLARVLVPLAVGVALLAGIGLVLLTRLSDNQLAALQNQPDAMATTVVAQWQRASASGARFALVGDSTCTNTYDDRRMSQRIGEDIVVLCTSSFMGPAGYAEILEQFLAHARPDAKAIVVIHPLQFQRQPSFETWAHPREFVKLLQGTAARRWDTPWRDTKLIYRRGLFSYLIDAPYGTEQLAAMIGGTGYFRRQFRHNGWYPLPVPVECYYCSVAELVRTTAVSAVSQTAHPTYVMDDRFLAALDVMRASVQRVGPERVFLVVSPLAGLPRPDERDGEVVRDRDAQTILDRIGLPSSHLLKTDAFAPAYMMPDGLHFGRPAAPWQSDQLADAIRGKFLEQPRQD